MGNPERVPVADAHRRQHAPLVHRAALALQHVGQKRRQDDDNLLCRHCAPQNETRKSRSHTFPVRQHTFANALRIGRDAEKAFAFELKRLEARGQREQKLVLRDERRQTLIPRQHAQRVQLRSAQHEAAVALIDDGIAAQWVSKLRVASRRQPSHL